MKSIKWATVLFLVATGFAGAAQTFTDTYNQGRPEPWHQGSYYQTGHDPVDVNHFLNGFNRGRSIVEAALSIEGLGVENVCRRFDQNRSDQPEDRYNGIIGQSQGILAEHTHRLNLLPYQAFIQSMSNASSGDSVAGRTIGDPASGRFSYLNHGSIDAGTESVELPIGSLELLNRSVPPPMVPAPSAIVLGSIGIIFVGWLRKRTAVE